MTRFYATPRVMPNRGNETGGSRSNIQLPAHKPGGRYTNLAHDVLVAASPVPFVSGPAGHLPFIQN
jgi:hypothetical protein